MIINETINTQNYPHMIFHIFILKQALVLYLCLPNLIPIGSLIHLQDH